MIIIGLDISSTTTGIAVLEDSKLTDFRAIKTNNRKKFPDIHSIAEEVGSHLLEIKENNKKVDKVFVEDNVKAFSTGFSSANTIIKLAKVNALVCYQIYKAFDIVPVAIMPSSARKAFGLKIPRKTASKDVKKMVLKKVVETEPTFSYTLTAKGNPKPGTYDMADAIVVARAGEVFVEPES